MAQARESFAPEGDLPGGEVLLKFLKSLNFKESGLFDAIGKASVIGLHMVSGIIVGGVMGYFLDEWLGTSPWLKIVFFILGVGAGFRNVYLDTKLLLKSQSGEAPAGRNGQDASGKQNKTEN